MTSISDQSINIFPPIFPSEQNEVTLFLSVFLVTCAPCGFINPTRCAGDAEYGEQGAETLASGVGGMGTAVSAPEAAPTW